MDKLKNIKAGDLNISYYETGKADGKPVFLLHGFPYDIQAYREVAPILAKEGIRCKPTIQNNPSIWKNASKHEFPRNFINILRYLITKLYQT